jgi:hypothetical protein
VSVFGKLHAGAASRLGHLVAPELNTGIFVVSKIVSSMVVSRIELAAPSGSDGLNTTRKLDAE